LKITIIFLHQFVVVHYFLGLGFIDFFLKQTPNNIFDIDRYILLQHFFYDNLKLIIKQEIFLHSLAFLKILNYAHIYNFLKVILVAPRIIIKVLSLILPLIIRLNLFC
jgi:hypothetical protein